MIEYGDIGNPYALIALRTEFGTEQLEWVDGSLTS